jgi:hypothetical protein
MNTLSIDYRTGWRYADEMLSTANPVEVLVCADQNWKARTAQHLIDVAGMRKANGVNPDYQDGVIARAGMD